MSPAFASNLTTGRNLPPVDGSVLIPRPMVFLHFHFCR
jgi:hypothetical protein